jgi:hypothetical protein
MTATLAAPATRATSTRSLLLAGTGPGRAGRVPAGPMVAARKQMRLIPLSCRLRS